MASDLFIEMSLNSSNEMCSTGKKCPKYLNPAIRPTGCETTGRKDPIWTPTRHLGVKLLKMVFGGFIMSRTDDPNETPGSKTIIVAIQSDSAGKMLRVPKDTMQRKE